MNTVGLISAKRHQTVRFSRLCTLISLTILLIEPVRGQSKLPDDHFRERLRAAGLIEGYLSPSALPEGIHLIPPPPASGSPQEQYDRISMSRVAETASATQIQIAIEDADIRFPKIASSFSCALGVDISEAGTPHLYQLMRRTFSDFVLPTIPIKAYYKRSRPFLVNSRPACNAIDSERLRNDGSYPSGHSAFGFGWALTLAGIAPDRTTALIQRGLEIGDGREACNVHWRSDIEQARLLVSIVLAHLQVEHEFRHDLDRARNEIEKIRSSSALPNGCTRSPGLADGLPDSARVMNGISNCSESHNPRCDIATH